MVFTSEKGYYRDGCVELTKQPEGIQEAEVIVTFLSKNGETQHERAKDADEMVGQMKEGLPFAGKVYSFRSESPSSGQRLLKIKSLYCTQKTFMPGQLWKV